MSGVCTFVYHAFTGCWGNRHNKTAKASSRPTHTTSVRGNLVKTYKIDINDDYILDIDQELGKGGCGVVVVGEHKELRTQYAIKIVDKSHAERGRLDRELKLLKDVDHTNIVRLFSVYDVPSHMYFVMELCLGGHLGNLLARQPRKYLDETWAKQLALQLLSAVAHIHSRGIAHRDIKLQNILVDQCTNDRTAQLKLIDFGYGSRFIGALPMRTKCGTPYTTAPEVIRECYDERCDVWSCGVVLYIMLCGRRPFEALNCSGTLADAGKAAMITNILAGRYHFNHKAWQTVSKQGVNFVKALLHPDYKQRMHSHEALENPWLIDSNIINVHAHILRSEKSFQAANNIRRMSEVSELHRAGMVALVFGINANTAAEMSAVFQSFDSDASGMLSKSEFCTAMQKIVPELTSSDLNKLFEIIDYDKNSLISYTEFLAATLDPREMDIGELNKAFRLFDEDGNGYISKDEMRKVIRMQCEQALANHQQLALQQALSPRSLNSHDTLAADMDALDAEVTAKVERIFAEADVNNDGAISHAEFLWVMTGLDFHLLERVGMPSEIGVSAKDTFMYNTKLNNSYDSAEDWNQDIDQPFEMEAGYAINGSSSNRQSKGPSYEPAIMLSATGSSTSFGRSFMKSPNRSLKQDALLDALMEKPADEPSSDGFPSGSERVLQVGVQSGPEAEAERPMQRHSRRPRDESVAAPRVDSPYLLAGLLKTPSGGVYQDELTCADPVVGGQGPAAPLGKQSSLAFYNEPPSISTPRQGDDDMDSPPNQYGSRTQKPPPLSLSRASSGRFGAAIAGLLPGSRQHSVRFDNTNLYKNDTQGDEKDDVSASVGNTSFRDLRGMLSRGPSYRESTIVDSSTGKETIRVLVKQGSSNAPTIPSMPSTRQNSGDVPAPASVVDPPSNDPVPPFLSRASSRVFSLSNMLRGNAEASKDHSMADVSMKVDAPMIGMPSSPILLPSGFTRAASIKSVKFGAGI